MDPDEIVRQMNGRFDRLEEKLDEYAKVSIENKRDIEWLKGSIKVSLSALTALAAAVLGGLIRVFTGK